MLVGLRNILHPSGAGSEKQTARATRGQKWKITLHPKCVNEAAKSDDG
jgi:hypothetical protein